MAKNTYLGTAKTFFRFTVFPARFEKSPDEYYITRVWFYLFLAAEAGEI